jgi:flagellar biosynthesis/type III secretory pathway M-ring protein FliF/YscJ
MINNTNQFNNTHNNNNNNNNNINGFTNISHNSHQSNTKNFGHHNTNHSTNENDGAFGRTPVLVTVNPDEDDSAATLHENPAWKTDPAHHHNFTQFTMGSIPLIAPLLPDDY